jgi:hypothetical protein
MMNSNTASYLEGTVFETRSETAKPHRRFVVSLSPPSKSRDGVHN